MAVHAAEGTILHVQDYLETSRLYRIVTRDEGVLSLLARGVRRGGRRATVPPDLFASGIAQLDVRPGRDLHTLREFETLRPRIALAADLGRFLAAGAVAEVVLRFVPSEPVPVAYDALVDGLDRLAAVSGPAVDGVALATLWRLVAALGVAPSVEQCAVCGEALPGDTPAMFHHRSGGVLCAPCATRLPGAGGRPVGARPLPAVERARLDRWLRGEPPAGGDEGVGLTGPLAQAHQRLLREFLQEHLVERRPLRAFAAWEGGGALAPAGAGASPAASAGEGGPNGASA